jgi:hypothetical protein
MEAHHKKLPERWTADRELTLTTYFLFKVKTAIYASSISTFSDLHLVHFHAGSGFLAGPDAPDNSC